MDQRVGNGADCGAIAPLLDGFAAAELDPEDERRVWTHLARCEECRAGRAALADPGALFLDLRQGPVEERPWDRFMERLGARLDGEALLGGRRWWCGWGEILRYPRLAYVAAPLAMILVVGATLFVMRPGVDDLPGPLAPADAVRSPFKRPVRTRPAQPDARIEAGNVPELTQSAAILESPGPPALEEVASPGARVYRFDVGADADTQPIYLVVDESIDF